MRSLFERSTGPRRPTLWLRREAAAAGRDVPQPGVRDTLERLVSRAEAAGADRVPRSRRLAARGAKGSSPRRSTGSRGGRSGTPAAGARRPDDRRRPGRLVRELGGAGHARVERLRRGEDRPVGSGPGAAADAVDPRRARRSRVSRPRPRAGHPRGGRGAQAGVRRPGGLVRRQRRRADEGAAVPGLRAGAGAADRRPGRRRATARPPQRAQPRLPRRCQATAAAS